MSSDIKTRLAKEILDFKWPAPTTDVMRGWNLALDSLVKYKLTNDIEKVVRCKDCKYQEKGENECEAWNLCGYRPWLHIPTEDDAFCSHGERKDG